MPEIMQAAGCVKHLASDIQNDGTRLAQRASCGARFLTDEGIEYLREYLNLPSDIVPATLKKSTRPLERVPDRPPRGDRFGGGGGGDRPRRDYGAPPPSCLARGQGLRAKQRIYILVLELNLARSAASFYHLVLFPPRQTNITALQSFAPSVVGKEVLVLAVIA